MHVGLLFLSMHSIYIVFLPLIMLFAWFSGKDVSELKGNLMEVYSKCEAEKFLDRKSYALEINENGFLRYRRVWKNNKSEYFSVKIEKVKTIDFYGSEKGGWLIFTCAPESVIYQTYRDPAGNIDSMTNEISFPVSSISMEELNRFTENFKSIQDILGIKMKN